MGHLRAEVIGGSTRTLAVLIRIMLAYLQTIAILSYFVVYINVSYENDLQIIPYMLGSTGEPLGLDVGLFFYSIIHTQSTCCDRPPCNSTAVFQDLGASIQQLQCFLKLSYGEVLAIYMAAPGACYVFAALVVFFIVLLLARCRIRRISTSEYARRVYYLSSILLFVVVPPVIGKLTSAQLCAELKNGFYLQSAPEVSCNEALYRATSPVARILVFLYLSLIVVAAVLLATGNPTAQRVFEFMWQGARNTFPIVERTDTIMRDVRIQTVVSNAVNLHLLLDEHEQGLDAPPPALAPALNPSRPGPSMSTRRQAADAPVESSQQLMLRPGVVAAAAMRAAKAKKIKGRRLSAQTEHVNGEDASPVRRRIKHTEEIEERVVAALHIDPVLLSASTAAWLRPVVAKHPVSSAPGSKKQHRLIPAQQSSAAAAAAAPATDASAIVDKEHRLLDNGVPLGETLTGIFYAWEMIGLLRRCLLASLAFSFVGLVAPLAQLALFLILVAGSLAAHSVWLPLEHGELNMVEGLSLGSQVAIAVALFVRLPSFQLNSSDQLYVPLFFDMCALFLTIPLYILWFLLLGDRLVTHGRLLQKIQVSMVRTRHLTVLELAKELTLNGHKAGGGDAPENDHARHAGASAPSMRDDSDFSDDSSKASDSSWSSSFTGSGRSAGSRYSDDDDPDSGGDSDGESRPSLSDGSGVHSVASAGTTATGSQVGVSVLSDDPLLLKLLNTERERQLRSQRSGTAMRKQSRMSSLESVEAALARRSDTQPARRQHNRRQKPVGPTRGRAEARERTKSRSSSSGSSPESGESDDDTDESSLGPLPSIRDLASRHALARSPLAGVSRAQHGPLRARSGPGAAYGRGQSDEDAASALEAESDHGSASGSSSSSSSGSAEHSAPRSSNASSATSHSDAMSSSGSSGSSGGGSGDPAATLDDIDISVGPAGVRAERTLHQSITSARSVHGSISSPAAVPVAGTGARAAGALTPSTPIVTKGSSGGSGGRLGSLLPPGVPMPHAGPAPTWLSRTVMPPSQPRGGVGPGVASVARPPTELQLGDSPPAASRRAIRGGTVATHVAPKRAALRDFSDVRSIAEEEDEDESYDDRTSESGSRSSDADSHGSSSETSDSSSGDGSDHRESDSSASSEPESSSPSSSADTDLGDKNDTC